MAPAFGSSSWVRAAAASENPVMAPRATAPNMSITPMGFVSGWVEAGDPVIGVWGVEGVGERTDGDDGGDGDDGDAGDEVDG